MAAHARMRNDATKSTAIIMWKSMPMMAKRRKLARRPPEETALQSAAAPSTDDLPILPSRPKLAELEPNSGQIPTPGAGRPRDGRKTEHLPQVSAQNYDVAAARRGRGRSNSAASAASVDTPSTAWPESNGLKRSLRSLPMSTREHIRRKSAIAHKQT